MENKACIFNIQRFSLHDGPGIRTSVFFKGCPLSCTWCSNPESQSFIPEKIWDNSKQDHIITGQFRSLNEIMEIILKDKDYYESSKGGVTLTGGEVLSQHKFASQLLRECKKHNIHTACETSAFASINVFSSFIEDIDYLIMDIKHHDTKIHKEKTGVDLDVIIKNIQHAVSVHKDFIIRIPIIPDFNDSIKDAHEFAKLLNSCNISQVELLPFHQFGKKKYEFLNRDYEFENNKQIHIEDLNSYKEVFEKNNISIIS